VTALENVLAALEIANKRIDELEKYNLDLASESFNKSNMIDYERGKNAELAAQVEVLGDKLSEVVALLAVDGMTAVQWLLDNCQEIEKLTDFEPEDCLLEVKADAGRDGFIEGVYWVTSCEFPISKTIAANQYASKIRDGKQ
jgi:hypothetical protein